MIHISAQTLNYGNFIDVRALPEVKQEWHAKVRDDSGLRSRTYAIDVDLCAITLDYRN